MTSREECRERFPDDLAIGDEVGLLRRIPKWHFVWDGNDGSIRPSSAAFEDDRDGAPMSVYRTDIITAEDDSVDRVMKGHAGFALVSITAGSVRRKAQTVHPEPLPEEASHAVVCGPKKKGTRRWFVRHCRWVIRPPA